MRNPTQVCVLVFSLILLGTSAWAVEDPPTFVLQWGSNGIGDGQLSGPHGIEVDANGTVYVADTGNNRIQKFTSEGVFLTKWGSFGTGPGQFNHPHGIGIGPTGDVYVAETGNNRVQQFTSQGAFIRMWGSFGDGNGQFRHTHELTADHNGNVFVVDRDQDRVQKFTSDGTFIMAWGTLGTGDGQFIDPNGLAVDAENNVFIADSSPRIQKFTNDGVFITSWGSAGTGDGQFNFPRGLSIDEMDNVYVDDRNLHRMQVFTGAGVFLTKWGSFGTEEGQFNFPYDLKAANGLVYVADSSNHRVQKFRVGEPIPGGACCDAETGMCTDGIDATPAACDAIDALGDFTGQTTYTANKTCDLVGCIRHTGACCDGTPKGVHCIDGTYPEDCDGPNQTWIKGEDCAVAACPALTLGACCDTLSGDCSDNETAGSCGDTTPLPTDQRVFSLDRTCANVTCDAVLGACCDEDAFGGCTNVTLAECTCPDCVWTKLGSCATTSCVHNAIPTVSEWGIVVLALLLLTGAKIYFGRLQASAA